MERLGFVEVLDRRGRVAERIPVTAAGLTIGRAFANDVILDDPYVSPVHATLIQADDGAMVLRDRDSENGVFDGGQRRVAQVTLTPGHVVRVGHTTLRYQSLAAPLAPTLAETRGGRDVLDAVRSGASRRAILAGAAVLFAAVFHQSSYEAVRPSDAMGAAFGGLALLGFWAGAWAFVTRVVSQRFRFWQHLSWAALMSGLFVILMVVSEYLEFLFSGAWVTSMLTGLVFLLLFALGLYGHFGIVGTMPHRRRLVVTGWITAGVIGMTALFAVAEEEEFSTEIPWSGTLKPIPTPLLPTISVEEFRRRAEALEEDIQAMTDP